MRFVSVLIFAASCEPGFTPRPLPELVKPPPPVIATAATARLLLPPGESLIWQVHADGIVIGRAELVVSDDAVRSKFATNALASMFAPVRYELATALDRAAARPHAAEETIAIAGDLSHAAASFDGTHVAIESSGLAGARSDAERRGASIDNAQLDAPAPIHTLHTALGWLRAWARDGAPPAVLYVVHDRELYRVEIAAPVRETLHDRATLRFDAHAGALALVVWISDDAGRVPVRIVAKAGGIHVVAELAS